MLDIDPRHDGHDTLAELERQHGALVETVTSHTGGGGRHLLFAHPERYVPTRAGIAPGIDVRGDGGYIVAPPSLHVSGKRYAWAIGRDPDELAIAPAPAWLLALVTATTTGRLRRDGTPLVIAAGARNDTLMRLGAALRRYGSARRRSRTAYARSTARTASPS